LLLARSPWNALAVLPLGALDSSFNGMTWQSQQQQQQQQRQLRLDPLATQSYAGAAAPCQPTQFQYRPVSLMLINSSTKGHAYLLLASRL
jgi:hypothetical protein